ncbi:MAG: HipA domain-containing protein [Solirubrobacteraceae bacterium]
MRRDHLSQPRPHRIVCRYSELALQRWPGNSPVLSCSLPVGSRPLDALAFCRGLLPEGRALEHMARQANVAVNDVFALLGRFGRDVAGALCIVEDGATPSSRQPQATRYSPEELERELDELPERPLALYDDSELSLAGLQDKVLLVVLGNGEWARPVHGYPSTHILEADDLRHPGLIDAEAACLRLAATVGLTSIAGELRDFGETHCLIVSRFDRRRGALGLPERIHQEDLCQATGIDPADARGAAKYERAGGPGLRQLAELLSAHAQDMGAQLDKLVAVMAFNVVIGNADAHGKNLALLHEPLGTVALAPLYDTVLTMLWPKLHADSAMSVAGVRNLERITLDDLAAEAASWRYSRERAHSLARETIERLMAAVEGPDFHEGVSRLVASRAKRLLSAR